MSGSIDDLVKAAAELAKQPRLAPASAIPVGVDEPLRWMRRYNRTAAQPVHFAGIDIPAAGGSLLPALAPVADHLRQIDSESLPAIRDAMRITESFAGPPRPQPRRGGPAWTPPNRTPSARSWRAC
ncbi:MULTISPECIES: erythromycin esterase family protein [unclassified Streptomyces]|uniref:erythromycin esterase family protein n=1 Tax=unclassified Streptomyces TaxID=2593676 RepID=UPI00381FD451